MTRYTQPQRHLKVVSDTTSKNPALRWLIIWNVLLAALAICFMVMTALNQWFCIPILILAPLVYAGFMKEENCRLRAEMPPRTQRVKELQWILSIAFMVAFLFLLGQI